MHYVFLIHRDPGVGRSDSEPAQRDEAFLAEQRAAGRFVAFVRLSDARGGSFLRKPAGAAEASASKAPLSEAEKQLTDLLVLQCTDLAEAQRLAAQLPAVQDGGVAEIRPVFDLAAAVRGEAPRAYSLD